MNADKPFPNDLMAEHQRRAFDEILTGDPFDDSVCDDHQSQLRSKVLQAFDRSNSQPAMVQPESSGGTRRHVNWNRILGYVAVIAVCLIGIITLILNRGSDSTQRSVVNHRPVPSQSIDSQLVASLEEVDAYRDVVSREALWNAIAMCQGDFEGRMAFDSNQP